MSSGISITTSPIKNSAEDVNTAKDAHNVCHLDNSNEFVDDAKSQWVNANKILRSGDRIEYYESPFVVGDPFGLRRSTIRSIHPQEESVLMVDKLFIHFKLSDSVKHMQQLVHGNLENTDGKFRPDTFLKREENQMHGRMYWMKNV